jgi:hypothetical protein
MSGAFDAEDYKRHVAQLLVGGVNPILLTLETMRASTLLYAAFAVISSAGLVERDTFTDGQPIDPSTGKGAPLLGTSPNVAPSIPHVHRLTSCLQAGQIASWIFKIPTDSAANPSTPATCQI